jgi:hypothetical protein
VGENGELLMIDEGKSTEIYIARENIETENIEKVTLFD